MKKFGLVKGWGFHTESGETNKLKTGFALGVNFAKLGISKNKMFKAYNLESWGQEYFKQLEIGYDSANTVVSNITEVSIDIQFILNQLTAKFKNTPFKVIHNLVHDSEGDSFYITGQGSEGFLVIQHETQAFEIIIKYTDILTVAGGSTQFWAVTVAFDCNENSIQEVYDNIPRKLYTKTACWNYVNVICFKNNFSITWEQRNLHNKEICHSKEVVELTNMIYTRFKSKLVEGKIKTKPIIPMTTTTSGTVGFEDLTNLWDFLN